MVACAVKVEIAFDSGFTTPAADRTYTDVSARAFGSVSIGWGRSDQFGTCEPLTCSLQLSNEDGALTPGNTGSAYYPNVKLDRPVRITVTPAGGAPSVRFVGYVDAWPMSWPFGTDLGSVCVNLTATSRTGRLGLRNALYSDLVENARSAGATAIWPLDEPEGSRQGLSIVSTDVLKIAGSGAPVTFSGTNVHLRGGQHLTSSLTLGTDYTVALSFFSTSRGGVDIMPVQTSNDSVLVDANDGRWHRLVLTVAGGVPSGADMYLDGAAVSVTFVNVRTSNLTLGTIDPSAWIRDVSYYPSVISGGDIADDYAAFNGGFGDMTDDRLVRYASFVDILPVEVDADAGAVAMGATDIAGLAALDAFRVVESTEGGVLTDARNGDLRLIGRGARYNSSPTVSLSVADEEVGADYSPTLDRFTLRNDVTGTNAATSMGQISQGEAVSWTARDDASIAEYGTAGGSIEINAADPTEAYAAASWMVANWSDPAPRVPNLTVDLLPLDLAQTAACLAVFVGDRVAITGRPSQDSTSTAEFFAEGGTETYAADGATITWSVSPIALNDSVLIFDESGHEFDAGYYFAR